MGVVIGMCTKHPGGPTRITVTDIRYSYTWHVMWSCTLWYAGLYSTLRIARGCGDDGGVSIMLLLLYNV